jgi:uncharacterized membrane protein
MHFEHSVSVAAPPQQVFDRYVDVARWPEWLETMTSVERLDDGPLRVGSRTRIKQPKLPVAVWEVTAVEPGHSWTWVARGPGIVTTASHVVTPAGDGSRVTASLDQQGPLGAVLGRLTKGMTERYLRIEGDSLKAQVERA